MLTTALILFLCSAKVDKSLLLTTKGFDHHLKTSTHQVLPALRSIPATYKTLREKLPPPLPANLDNLYNFFNAKNVDLSDIQNISLSKILLKLRQNTCFVGHEYNLKNSSNYWHFGGSRLLLLTKNALMKR